MEISPEATRRSIRIGSFVLALAAAGLIATLLVSGYQWRPTRTWLAYTSFEDGLTGLRPGSAVRLGGVQKGWVKAIQVDDTVRKRVVTEGDLVAPSTGGFIVSFELDSTIQLYADARIVRESSALSGKSELDIESVGGRRSAPLPGVLNASAMVARRQPPSEPFILAMGPSALHAVLGHESALAWEKISANAPAVRSIFIATDGPLDPLQHDEWGPNHPSKITVLRDAVLALRDRMANSQEPLTTKMRSVESQWRTLTESIQSEGGEVPGPLARMDQMRTLFDNETGIRRLWNDITPIVTNITAQAGPLRGCIEPLVEQGRMIATMARLFWPEIKDDMLMTKVGMVIAAAELWIMGGPEFWTTAIRFIQPFSQREQSAMLLILAADRTAESAVALKGAIEAARSAWASGGSELSPEVRTRLERDVVPALQRYRRDLNDMMRSLDAAAAAR